MEIDFAFRYGLFGYGFGSQVEQKQLDQKYILSQSIFPRVPVPGFRKDSDFVCEPIHVDYPDFINLDFFLIDIQYIFKTQTISNPLFENLYSDITSSL